MTRCLLVALVAFAAGCAFGDDSEAERVDRCVDRLLSRARPETLIAERRSVVERYARETYCERFAREGWVYEDGTLSIDAHRAVTEGRESDCESAGRTSDTACPESVDRTLDCALLHHVRRDEVREYLRELQRRGPVLCDDGTPLDQLGAE